MSETDTGIRLNLAKEEASVMLMMVALGSQAYDGDVPNRQIIELLDRFPPKHLRALKIKLEQVSDLLESVDGL